MRRSSKLYNKDLAPTVWCMVESRKILRGEIPFNYKKDTR